MMRHIIDLIEAYSNSYYHVTERSALADILSNGFLGGYGDAGFGVYFYDNLYDAIEYSRKGGWDGNLHDPVIILVSDRSIEKVPIDPSWDITEYENMYWHPMDDDDDENAWLPKNMRIISV